MPKKLRKMSFEVRGEFYQRFKDFAVFQGIFRSPWTQSFLPFVTTGLKFQSNLLIFYLIIAV
jgi:hypothetical protein